MYNGRSARLNPGGYILVFEPNHPEAARSVAKGWILEHRLIAERLLSRRLERGEIVHHINGIKTDNRPENLRVMSKQAHRKLHSDEITEKLRRLEQYERLYGPLREGPVTEANLRTLKTKGVQ